jgi:hypothetical protein
MARIPGLPRDWVAADGSIVDLSIVPDGPNAAPDLIDFAPFQENFITWASEVNRYRRFRLLATEGHIHGLDSEKERAKERERCRVHGAKYFITTWCWVHETRGEELRHYPWYDPSLGGWIPAILFAFQCDLIDWFERRMASEGTGRNGAGSKSRDMGFTWMFMLWVTHGFLFKRPFIAHCLSRNEDVVDTIGDISSMIERSASQLVEDRTNMNLPYWMLPDGWSSEHRKTRHITSPESRNGIHGESTNTKAGRSQRASVIGVDEVNFIEQDRIKKIRAGLMSTSPHVFMWSSESIEEHELFQEWKASLSANVPDALIELDYWLQPFHDLRWLRSMEEAYEDDPEAFAREVLRDPHQGFGGWMYPDAREMGTVNAEEWEPKEHGHGVIYLGIDPGLDDETAVHWVLHDPVCGSDVLINSYETGHRESAEFIAAIISGANPDDHPEFGFSHKDRELMEWVRSIPQPKMIFGDPYGFREHAGKDDSWYARMRLWWGAHNPKTHPMTGKPMIYPIVANTKTFQGQDARSYQARRQSLSRWMRMKLLFADTPEVKWTLHCIQNSRWDVSDRPRSTVQKDAKHDRFSHRRSALEYVATNIEVLDFMSSDVAKDRKYRPGTRTKAAA